MDEEKAKALAEVLGGFAWNSGGDIWLAVLERHSDGAAIVFSDELIAVYENVEALQEGSPPLKYPIPIV